MSLTSSEGTIATTAEIGHDAGSCGAREVLDRVGDKWSLYVIKILGGGTKRFSDLRREVEPITPRMLTVTLRTLERDGLISRKIYPVVPPRVEYTLTQMGETLVEAVAPLIGWANSHLAEIERARVAYDSKIGAGEDPG
jgi:DNA-binding HxlR family transcriptional regulator